MAAVAVFSLKHMAYEAGGLGEGRAAAPRLGQNHYFLAEAKFLGQKPAAKMKRNICFVFIKRKKRN